MSRSLALANFALSKTTLYRAPTLIAQGELRVVVYMTGTAYIEDRMALLRSAFDQTDALAREDKLLDAELNGAGLKISPLQNSPSNEAETLRDALAACFRTSRSRTC